MTRMLKILLCAMLTLPVLHASAQATFGDDVAFVKKYVDVIILKDPGGQAEIAVVPAYQARVITSSATGDEGRSYGWVNRDLISSGKLQPHINVFGGEDRIWLGPEGGQFSLFFKNADPFDLEHWQTPAPLDSEPFKVITSTASSVVCRREIHLTNYSNTSFDLVAAREIQLQDAAKTLKGMGVDMPSGIKGVAFATINSVTNTGKAPWTRKGGLLSLWILGMFNASPSAAIVVPYKPGSESERGPVVHDTYFGKVPSDRLKVEEGVLFLKADANYRSKIGIPPRRAKHILGSFDPSTHTLTLVSFTLPGNTTQYVNSMWEIQKDPFSGDVANAYNDGPPQPGAKQLGQFYELESSSPALALRPGQKATHTQTTIHLQGKDEDLDGIAAALLGVSLERITNAFRP